jgi:uncharacterized membrane protein
VALEIRCASTRCIRSSKRAPLGFILMRQNRMMRRGERRDHLNLQVDLLADKKITTVLQMVRAICEKVGPQNIAADKDIRELNQNTSIESLSRRLEDRLPEE